MIYSKKNFRKNIESFGFNRIFKYKSLKNVFLRPIHVFNTCSYPKSEFK